MLSRVSKSHGPSLSLTEELFNHLSLRLGKERKRTLELPRLPFWKELAPTVLPLRESTREEVDLPSLISLLITDTENKKYNLNIAFL